MEHFYPCSKEMKEVMKMKVIQNYDMHSNNLHSIYVKIANSRYQSQ